MKILGIDLGKFNSVACLLETETQDTLFFSFKSYPQEFLNLLSQTKPDLVVIEACTIAGWVHDLYKAENVEVLVANTSQQAWCWKHVKRKTDKDDALKLTKLAYMEQIVPVYVPSVESRQYRQLVKYRKRLMGRINKNQNTIRSLFNQQGISIPVGAKAWSLEGLEKISQYSNPLEDCDELSLWQGQLEIEMVQLDCLWQDLHQVDQKLTQLAKANSSVKLLETIPGIGRKTAEVVVAYLDDATRFKTARQVSAYAGLVPKQFQSGNMNRMGKITRRGPRVLRTALVEAAWVMLRYNPWAETVYNRICGGQKTRRKQAAVALARKILVLCWTLLRKNEPWDESKAMRLTHSG